MTDNHDARVLAAFKAAGLSGTPAKRPTRTQINRSSDILADVTEFFDLSGAERDAVALVREVLDRVAGN